MLKGRESLCCAETPQIRTRAGDSHCIIDHEGFAAVCLNRHVIEAAIYQFVDEEQRGYIDDTPACE